MDDVQNRKAKSRRRRGRPSESYPEERRAMRFADWPALDQAAWTVAIATPADIFEDAGRAAALRESTRRNRVQAWGRFLTFLDLAGELDRSLPPEARPTRKRIGDWIRVMRPTQRASTTQRLLIELSLCIAAMSPEVDWAWIRHHGARPTPAQIRAERRPIVPFDAPALVRGILARLAVLEEGERTVETAQEVRDLTVVLVGVYTALRSTNLGELCLGKQLRETEEGFAISLEAEETKTGRPLEVMLAQTPAVALRRYLDHWRPILLGEHARSPRVWLNRRGTQLGSTALYQSFQRVGLAILGRPIRPHLVRHTMATGVLMNDPSDTKLAGAGLGHSGSRSVNEVYDRSGTAGAFARWGKLKEGLTGKTNYSMSAPDQ